MRLHQKIGVITAAASGMGRAGAIRFAQEGAAVGVVDIDEDGANEVTEAIRAAGGRAIALVGDLSDDGFSREIVEKTAAEYGGLDFAWCHAGHPGPASVEDMDMDLWDLAVDLNLRTAVQTTAAALPHMRKRGGGSLLYTSSTSGLRGSLHSPAYSAMKFGIVGWARSLATRLAPENIRANLVCPGGVDTPMLRTFLARPDSKNAGDVVEDLVVARGKSAPLGRTGRPEEVANAALFLISDEASYVSGVALPVDGATIA